MSLADIKNDLVNEAHKLEAKIEGAFTDAKTAAIQGAATVETDAASTAKTVETTVESRVSALEADFADFKARIESFNAKSGQKI